MEGNSVTLFDMVMKGGIVVFILGIGSFITLAIAIERILFFSKLKLSEINSLQNDIIKGFAKKNISESISACEAYDNSFSRVIKTILISYDNEKNKDKIKERAMSAIEIETFNMEKNIGVLGTIGNISPYVGLFGTVVGVMKAFRDLGISGASGAGVVMQGISEALVATACGLAVAILSVVFYNYFLRKVKKTLKQLEIFSEEIIEKLYKMA